MNDSPVVSIQKTMVRGGFAAAAPGLVAMVAATTAAQSTLAAYTGLSSLGVAALGIVFFCMAFLFARSRWWAGIPSLVCVAMGIWLFSVKAVRLLILYYQFNPIRSLTDVMAPFSIIALHVCLLVIAATLGWVMIKALRLGRRTGPQPVSRHVWAILGIWLGIVVWQGATPFGAGIPG